MNRTMNYIAYLWLALLSFSFYGCSEEMTDNPLPDEGTLLSLYVGSTGISTRLSELGSAADMGISADGKYGIGLYIYYQDDYDNNDLSKPYIRNLECKVSGTKIVPASGDENIYIYDRMTIVAFYPYNDEVSDFKTQADEKQYPITESDYADQTYIPYRAQSNVDPTDAYMVELDFIPQQTSKVQVVLVADDPSFFPQSDSRTDGSVKLLPNIDPLTDDYTGTDRREFWFDRLDKFTPSPAASGRYVRRYTAYIWKSGENDSHHDDNKHDDNILEKGDLLFQSDELTLIVPYDVDLSETRVYRYGYNMNTGEIFIPTSENLVYDATTLQATGSAYQVCDIDLKDWAWTPITYYSGTYDGGGHAIKNLVISAAPTGNNTDNTGWQAFGLFGSVIGGSTLKNIYLESPSVEVDYTDPALTDTCYAGALCGIANPTLPESFIRDIIADGLPSELSDVVKEALIQDQMEDFTSTTCTIQGCKVENPKIVINGENVIAGGLCGAAGNQKQKAVIKDSYVSQTSASTSAGIAVNAATDEMKEQYETAYVSGFCGLLSAGSITNCYSTLTTVEGYVKEVIPATENEPESTQAKDVSTGFCNVAGELPAGITAAVEGCYTEKDDATAGVTGFSGGWPNWPLFAEGSVSNGLALWPALSWENSWKDMGDGSSTYPTLIWESPFIVENK